MFHCHLNGKRAIFSHLIVRNIMTEGPQDNAEARKWPDQRSQHLLSWPKRIASTTQESPEDSLYAAGPNERICLNFRFVYK